MSYSCIDHGATACDGCMNPNHKQVNGGIFAEEQPRAHREHNKKLKTPLKLAHWKRGCKKVGRKG
jgi:hypothetical protein